MTWNCYSTIFKTESPVHIGYKQIGILKTTRYYITGRAMWGAITANLTRALFNHPALEDYQAVGNFVRGNIRTTYFYPAIKKNEAVSENWSEYEVNDYLVFLPKYTKEGINFGNKSKEWFEQRFVGSFVSTALESQTRTAEEGSLDVSNAKVKDVKKKKVYEVNISEENDDLKITFKNKDAETYAFLKKDVLNMLFVGGERNYGFGKIMLESPDFRLENQRLFGKFKLELDADEPVVEIDTALVHLNLEDIELKEELKGEVEPVVGLEWSDKGAGQSISEAIICVTPGSEISGKYVLGEYGIIEALRAHND